MAELNESTLNTMYNQIQTEQQKFMVELRSNNISSSKQKELHRRVSFLQSLLVGLLKYKEIKIEE